MCSVEYLRYSLIPGVRNNAVCIAEMYIQYLANEKCI